MATATKGRVRSKGKPVPADRRKQAATNQLRDLRHRYGLSQALLARMLDVSLRTLSAAESAATVSPQMQRGATQAARLCDALGEVMQPLFVGQWLNQPNEMFGELKPIEAVERGQIDLVWQVIEGLRSGSQL
jgi:transcriptional regulator with XRE-family HTH domain